MKANRKPNRVLRMFWGSFVCGGRLPEPDPEVGQKGGKREKELKFGDIVEQLRRNRSPREFSLIAHKLNSGSVTALCEALRRNQSLEALDLSKSFLGREGGTAMGEVLLQNECLTALNLCGTALGVEGGKALAEGLAKNVSLQCLNVSRTGMGKVGSVAMAEALEANRTLRCLKLADIASESVGCREILRALTRNYALTCLDLGSNSMGKEAGPAAFEEVGQALGEALLVNTTLTQLHIEKTFLGAEGGQALGQALLANTTLRDLNVAGTGIGAEGGVAVAHSLTINTSLTRLTLSGIGDRGLMALGTALRTNRSLEALTLSVHSGLPGWAAFGAVLRDHPRLSKLALDCPDLPRAAEALGLPPRAGGWTSEAMVAHFRRRHLEIVRAFLRGARREGSVVSLLNRETMDRVCSAYFGQVVYPWALAV